jgi:Ser/Thr protein kinase RdoA (MazF antagonist)
MAPSTILAHVTRFFPLKAPATCQLIKQGLNDTYLFSLRESRFIVRVYSASRVPSEIAYELELLVHLAGRDVPVPVPLTACDGSLGVTVGAPEGVRTIVLFSHAEGAQMALDKTAHCRLAGRLLARFHSAADDFASTHWRRRLDASYLIDGPLQAVRPFLTHRPADLTYLEDLASRLRARLTREANAGLDWGVCHGDFGAKNIHAGTAEEDATVIDFDFCGEGWRAYDFAPMRRATFDQAEGVRWDAFLNGYGDVRPIRSIDLDAVMLFRGLRQLAMLGVFAQHVDVWGIVPLEDRSLNRWLRFLREWDIQYFSGRDQKAG